MLCTKAMWCSYYLNDTILHVHFKINVDMAGNALLIIRFEHLYKYDTWTKTESTSVLFQNLAPFMEHFRDLIMPWGIPLPQDLIVLSFKSQITVPICAVSHPGSYGESPPTSESSLRSVIWSVLVSTGSLWYSTVSFNIALFRMHVISIHMIPNILTFRDTIMQWGIPLPQDLIILSLKSQKIVPIFAVSHPSSYGGSPPTSESSLRSVIWSVLVSTGSLWYRLFTAENVNVQNTTVHIAYFLDGPVYSTVPFRST